MQPFTGQCYNCLRKDSKRGLLWYNSYSIISVLTVAVYLSVMFIFLFCMAFLNFCCQHYNACNCECFSRFCKSFFM